MAEKELTFQEKLAAIKAKHDAIEQGSKEEFAEKLAKNAAFHEAKRRSKAMDELVGKGKGKPGIPDLSERIAETRALLQRSKELRDSQERIVNELAANPLEQQCDAVYAEMGQKLYALEGEELAAAEDAGRFLEEDEQNDEADENRERSGQPPPLRRVK